MCRIIRKIATIALGVALAAVLVMFPKTLAAKNWADGTALWSPGTWSPAGVPVANEAVNIVFTDGAPRTVAYNVNAPSLGLFSVDVTGAGTTVSEFSMPSNNTFTAKGILIGGYNGITSTQTAGRGLMTQSAGTATTSPGFDFVLGYGANSTGTYALSGTGALVANQSEYVGLYGNGTFNHSAGTNSIATATGFFDIGTYAGSSGTYNLSGTGALTVKASEYVGNIGTGVFNQTGGTHTISGQGHSLYLGYDASGTGGTYTLSAGDLLLSNIVQDEYIGYNASGSFNQSGGTNTVPNDIELGSNSGATGAYTLSGGTLSDNWEIVGNQGSGIFNHTGGSTVSAQVSVGNFGTGTYNLGGSGSLSTIFEEIGVNGNGTMSQTGGTNAVTAQLEIGEYVGSTGVYALSAGLASISSFTTVGGDYSTVAGGSGVLTVTGTGVLTCGDVLKVYNTAGTSLNLNGGTINATALNFGGVPALFNWTSGKLNLNSNVIWDSAADPTSTSAAFGSSLGLGSNRTLMITGNETLGGIGGFSLTLGGGSSHIVTGSITIDPTGILTLEGGTLSLGTLANNGTFNFIAGTLNVNQANASINTPIVTGNPSTININADNISLGSAASFSGFSHQGVLNVGANTITLNSAGYAKLGVLTTLAGGTINAANGIAFASGSNLQGRGALNARVAGELGSVIEATGGLILGDATSPAGFNYAGELRTKQFSVTLNSSAPVGLGNLTTLGNGGVAGTLTATNGFVVDFDEAISGFGTLSSINTLAKHATINGTVQGNSAGQPITLSGYIKGVGTFDNVTFTGTYSPGLSPTIATVGSITLTPTSTLLMEVGGTTAGGSYDQIQATGTLSLGGTLAVSLINGFNPGPGSTFDILDWSALSGTFSAINLPALGGGLTWNTSLLYTSGVLSVASASLIGDYNSNGVVDAADYIVWRKNQGTTHVLPNDPIGGTIGTAQHDQWRAHFGQPPGSGAGASLNAAVPEPSTLVLLTVSAAGWNLRRRRAT